MKNIIIGHGNNINFDNDKKRWRHFITDCQQDFLDVLESSKNSKNKSIHSIYLVWNTIKKHINLKEEENSLENIVKYFDFNYYENIMEEQEYEFFLQELWGITMIGFKEPPFQIPEISASSLFVINSNLSMLKEIYKNSIKKTLIEKYKIHNIKIPYWYIDFLNHHFDNVITLNYDLNIDEVNNVKYLHGKFGAQILNYDSDKNIDKEAQKRGVDPQQIREYVSWVKNNTIQEDIVLESFSNIKRNSLKVLEEMRGQGLKKMLKIFGVENNMIDFKKLQVSKVDTYDLLSQLSGDVYIVGASPQNDELIVEYLVDNNSINKIIIFTSNPKEKFSDHPKVQAEHFDVFWNLAKK